MVRFNTAWSAEEQPILTTDRLRLRPFVPTDAPRVHELCSDRALADTTQLPHPYPPGAAEEWIASHAARWAAARAMSYAITLQVDGATVGTVSLIVHAQDESAELGYWVGRSYWGRGYATEAAGALLAFGFGVVGLHRAFAPYLVRNPASGRVLEKLGMTLEGVSRESFRKWNVWEDIAHRAILRREWEAARGIGGT